MQEFLSESDEVKKSFFIFLLRSSMHLALAISVAIFNCELLKVKYSRLFGELETCDKVLNISVNLFVSATK